MKNHRLILSLFVLSFFVFQSCKEEKQQGAINLSGTWQMIGFDQGEGVVYNAFSPDFDLSEAIPAKVPGTARQALLAAGKISDPYYGYQNEKSLWVESKEWWFFKDFKVDPYLKNRKVFLQFDGTVFEGKVWLNGKEIGELKGMFNPRSFDVSEYLDYSVNNHIAVCLKPVADATWNPKLRGLSFDLERDQDYSFAQCFYGWDWGPHAVPTGIWKPVELKFSGNVLVEHPYVLTKLAPDYKGPATLDIKYEVKNLSADPVKVKVEGIVRDLTTNEVAATVMQQSEFAKAETTEVATEIVIDAPRLWWPNGMGEQSLYELELKVYENGKLSDVIKTTFGIRELKLVNNDNVEENLKGMTQWWTGEVTEAYPWTFQVNGKKMFAKGGNWIPVDALLRLNSRYEHLLKLAKDAHFNLLRVWGGGLYETEEFYNLCDKYGIMAWQEFLSNRDFSHIDEDNFLEGVEAAVYRIRNHPSLTFWCGGNEFDPDDKGSKKVIDDLEAVLKKLDPSREFHRASPYMGDDHYWDVWHGLHQPYTGYGVVRPFRSESGINTFPVAENFKKFTPEKYRWPLDETYIEYRGERHPRFEHLLKLERYANEFGKSSDIDEFIMKSQLYQALGNKYNMEFCRAHKFQNSGLLVWQYNDNYPTLSWSLVDWYGTPKPSYYFMKRASRPLAAGAVFYNYLWEAGDTLTSDIFVMNDNLKGFDNLKYKEAIYTIDGRELAKTEGTVSIGANISKKAGTLEWKVPAGFKGKSLMLYAGLIDAAGNIISETFYPMAVSKQKVKTLKELNIWYDKEKLYPYYEKYYSGIFDEMNSMPEVKLQAEIVGRTAVKNGEATVQVKVSNPSDHIAYFIRIKPEEVKEGIMVSFSDNYFSLLPGGIKNIEAEVSGKKVKSDNDVPSVFSVSGWNVSTIKIRDEAGR